MCTMGFGSVNSHLVLAFELQIETKVFKHPLQKQMQTNFFTEMANCIVTRIVSRECSKKS